MPHFTGEVTRKQWFQSLVAEQGPEPHLLLLLQAGQGRP